MPPPYISKSVTLLSPSTGDSGCSYPAWTDAKCGGGTQIWEGRRHGGCDADEGNHLTCLNWDSQNSGKNYCPVIGATVSSAAYQGDGSQRVICTYSTLPSDSKLFSDSEMAGVFDGSSTIGVVKQMRKDRCAEFNYAALKTGTTTCKSFYDAQGAGTYDAELFKRVVSEGASWITNASKRQFVMTCITGASSDLARDATNLFLDRINGVNGNSYQGIAVSNMPSDLKDTWGQYTEIVGFINQLLRTSTEAAGINVPALTQTLAIATIRAYCTSHSDHTACSCVNATKVPSSGVDPLTRCGTTDASLPGCADIKQLNDQFAAITSPNLAPFVAGIKRAFIPRCYSSMCTAADTAGNQDVLRPDVYQPAACAADLNVCISSISAGRDINADVNVQQSCAGATGQAYPSELSSVTDRSGETVTAGGAGSPATTSGPTRQGCIAGTCTQGDVTFQESDLIIKPGTNEFVDKYLQTPNKQKGAIGGCICCILICCCLILLIMMSGGEEGVSNASAAPAAPNYSANISKLRALASSL